MTVSVADMLLLVRVVTAVAFALLALIAVTRARRGGRAGRWAAVAFGSLAAFMLAEVVSDVLQVELSAWLLEAAILLLVAFPFLLLRFTASFTGFPRWLEVAAALGFGGMVVAVVVILGVPPSADIDPEVAEAFNTAALLYWALLSSVTVVTLWRAGTGQPTVARRRLRMMSSATTVLAVALLVAQASPVVVQVVVQVIALFSAAAFTVGLSPPSVMRVLWRRTEERHLQEGMLAALRAGTVDEVAHALLPPTMRIVGGSSAALINDDGRVLAAHGGAVVVGAGLDGECAGPAREVMPLGEGHGALVVWTSPYTPFFGREEVELLRTMGVVMALALQRAEWLEDERAQRLALEQAQQVAERAREAALQANKVKNAFLSRMSHELRTPLNAILGFGQLLETSVVADDDREGVAQIVKAGRHLLALINDVLDLSRIEADALPLSLEPVYVEDLVDEAVSLITPLADSQGINVIVTGGCDTYVTADRHRCRQVLVNLLSNAVKYNHVSGEVRLGCRLTGDDTLRISVRDTGRGIDPSRRQQLFEPFERLGAEDSGVEGTGLGLALSRQLVERMGGAIGLESEMGVGSRFWIDLPIAERPADLDHDLPRSDVPAMTNGRTLLLVEDNLVNLRVVEAMLRRVEGIAVLSAMQGSLAVDMAREHQPDVIVLDLHLPDMSGHEVLRRLKDDVETRDIPVVIASADATPGRVQKLREDGAFAYLTKPLDLRLFLDVVGAALTERDGTQPRVERSEH